MACVKPRLLLLLIPLLASAQTAQDIMAKVAINQERAESARAGFVYRQDVLVRLQRTDGKLAREEDREYTVTPAADGIQRALVHFSGKYGIKSKEFSFSEPGEHYRGTDIDADIVKSLADSFGNGEDSRDGVNQDLFPLAANKQKGYSFVLAGEEKYHNHDVYRITFEPRQKDKLADEHDAHWAGEALIDKTDFAPVLITTHLARGIPIVVKTLLGTNLQQIGFKIVYERFDDGLWFPVNYSGELKMRILFMYARTVSLKLVNSEFKRADVKSTITFEK